MCTLHFLGPCTGLTNQVRHKLFFRIYLMSLVLSKWTFNFEFWVQDKNTILYDQFSQKLKLLDFRSTIYNMHFNNFFESQKLNWDAAMGLVFICELFHFQPRWKVSCVLLSKTCCRFWGALCNWFTSQNCLASWWETPPISKYCRCGELFSH